MLYVVTFPHKLPKKERGLISDLFKMTETTEAVFETENFFLVSSALDKAEHLSYIINPLEDEAADIYKCLIAPVTEDHAAFLDRETLQFIKTHAEVRPNYESPKKDGKANIIPDKDTIDFSSCVVRDARKIADLLLDTETVQAASKIMAGVKFRRDANAYGYNVEEGFQNILISGLPGVGKTTLAKSIAAAYLAGHRGKSERPTLMIKPDNVIGRYSGQTLNNLKQAFDYAKNGVIIFDEIDSYEKIASFGMDVINGLNVHMGNNPNAPMIIGTLYESSVNRLFGNNAGLKSRFRHHIQIPGQDCATLSSILIDKLADTRIKIMPEVKRQIPSVIQEFKKSTKSNFGHIRDVENIRDFIIDSLARRSYEQKIHLQDIKITMNDLPTRDFKTGALVSYTEEITPTQRETANVVELPFQRPS